MILKHTGRKRFIECAVFSGKGKWQAQIQETQETAYWNWKANTKWLGNLVIYPNPWLKLGLDRDWLNLVEGWVHNTPSSHLDCYLGRKNHFYSNNNILLPEYYWLSWRVEFGRNRCTQCYLDDKTNKKIIFDWPW